MKKLVFILFIGISIVTSSCSNNQKEEQIEKKIEVVKKVVEGDESKTTAAIEIEGMTCAMGCAKTIEKHLKETVGVNQASVDFDSKIATIDFDDKKLTEKDLISVIEAVADGKYSAININIEKTVSKEEKVETTETTTTSKENKETEQISYRSFEIPNVFEIFGKLLFSY